MEKGCLTQYVEEINQYMFAGAPVHYVWPLPSLATGAYLARGPEPGQAIPEHNWYMKKRRCKSAPRTHGGSRDQNTLEFPDKLVASTNLAKNLSVL